MRELKKNIKKKDSINSNEQMFVNFGEVITIKPLNQIEMSSEINMEDMNPKKAFFFLVNLKKYYLDLSNDHKSFEINNNSKKILSLGDTIKNKESAINHEYKEIEYEQDMKLVLESKKTTVRGKYLFIPYKVIKLHH